MGVFWSGACDGDNEFGVRVTKRAYDLETSNRFTGLCYILRGFLDHVIVKADMDFMSRSFSGHILTLKEPSDSTWKDILFLIA